jgi:hypothetical protein
MKLRHICSMSILIFFLVVQAACLDFEEKIDEGVVISDKVEVISSTALIHTRLGQVKKGDRLDITDRINANGIDYVKIRFQNPQGRTQYGWIESRHIVSQKILARCQELLQKEGENLPTQIQGKLKVQSNLRLSAKRDAEVVVLLRSETAFDVIKHARVEEKLVKSNSDETPDQPDDDETDVRLVDWYLVRFPKESIFPGGWIYGPAMELIAPEPLPSLVGSGRRVTGCVPIGSTKDKEGVLQTNYIVLDKSTFNRDNSIDFDRIYIVEWDPKREEYTSIYRESDVRGTYPIVYQVGDGRTEFTVSLLDKQNRPVRTKYEIRRDMSSGFLQVKKVGGA